MQNIPELPVCTKTPIIYVSTDRTAEEAGCAWGLLVAHDAKAGDFWVLTSIGVRYYGIQSEHEFIDRDDHRWAAVHTTWQVGLGKVGELQRTMLTMLFERSLQQQRALQAEQAHLATQKAE